MTDIIKVFTRFIFVAAALGLLCSLATASTDCIFKTDSTKKTMTLSKDCWTDSAIQIPDGYTLNGSNHIVRMVDPPSGHFAGPAITNAGPIANVKSVIIEATLALGPPCNTMPVGIEFMKASGTISNSTIINVDNGCGGLGIFLVGDYSTPQAIVVTGNKIFERKNFSANNFEAMGIQNLQGKVTSNVIQGCLALSAISSGVLTISSNFFESSNTPGAGCTATSLQLASGSKFTNNNINVLGGYSERGLEIFNSTGLTVTGNRIYNYGPTYGTGIDISESTNIKISGNVIRCFTDGNIACPF